jgi:hypothetical protein
MGGGDSRKARRAPPRHLPGSPRGSRRHPDATRSCSSRSRTTTAGASAWDGPPLLPVLGIVHSGVLRRAQWTFHRPRLWAQASIAMRASILCRAPLFSLPLQAHGCGLRREVAVECEGIDGGLARGTVSCSEPVTTTVDGSIQQRVGRAILRAGFFTIIECDGVTPWEVQVFSDSWFSCAPATRAPSSPIAWWPSVGGSRAIGWTGRPGQMRRRVWCQRAGRRG